MRKMTNGVVVCLVNPKRRREVGFTLIELLVVIAIIALLVSILLPSLNKAKDLAKRVACASQMKSICMGVNLYTGDYDGKLPFLTVSDIFDSSYNLVWNPSFNAMFGGKDWLRDEYFPYEAMDCPGDETREVGIDFWPYYPDALVNLSYAYNGRLSTRSESPPYGKFWYQTRSIDDFPSASDNVALFETCRIPPFFGPNYFAQLGGYNATGGTAELNIMYELHHGDGNNFGFLDAHVEFATTDDYLDSLRHRGDIVEVPGLGRVPINYWPDM